MKSSSALIYSSQSSNDNVPQLPALAATVLDYALRTDFMDNTVINNNGWDTICNQCGQCCLEKLEDSRGRIIYTDDACKYLDLETRRCKIFERRFEINPDCVQLTPELVATLRWLPKECAYRPPAEPFKRKTSRSRKKRTS